MKVVLSKSYNGYRLRYSHIVSLIERGCTHIQLLEAAEYWLPQMESIDHTTAVSRYKDYYQSDITIMEKWHNLTDSNIKGIYSPRQVYLKKYYIDNHATLDPLDISNRRCPYLLYLISKQNDEADALFVVDIPDDVEYAVYSQDDGYETIEIPRQILG